MPAPGFRSAQQKLLPAIMERLTANMSFQELFFCRAAFPRKITLNWVLIHRFQPKSPKTVVSYVQGTFGTTLHVMLLIFIICAIVFLFKSFWYIL